MNFRYPIFLDLTGKRCLVTGEGGEVATKIRELVASGAKVLYVNPRAEAEIADLAAKGTIEWRAGEFAAPDLNGCFLVITALADNSEIFRLAEERNIFCNAADDPEHCRFIFGSVHRQGDLTMAVSTNGAAPALAVRVRQRLEREFGPEYSAFIDLLKQVREAIKSRIPEFPARREIWYRIVDSSALENIRAGKTEEARAIIRSIFERRESNNRL